MLSKYGERSIVVAPVLLVIVRSLFVRLKSCISFVGSKSASFIKFVKSTFTGFPSSIAIVNMFVDVFRVALVKF